MILKSLLLLAALLTIMALGERLLDYFKADNEASRKLVHIIHGVGLAILAFVVPLKWVVLIEVVNLLVMVVARYVYTHYDRGFRWVRYLGKMYRVGRQSYGEFFYPISVIVVALIAESKWEFATAMLVLGISDAVAALVGKKYGRGNTYRMFSQRKSVAGTAAFVVVTMFILSGYAHFHGNDSNLLVVFMASCILAATENLGLYGSDNFTIPVVAVLLLNAT